MRGERRPVDRSALFCVACVPSPFQVHLQRSRLHVWVSSIATRPSSHAPQSPPRTRTAGPDTWHLTPGTTAHQGASRPPHAGCGPLAAVACAPRRDLSSHLTQTDKGTCRPTCYFSFVSPLTSPSRSLKWSLNAYPTLSTFFRIYRLHRERSRFTPAHLSLSRAHKMSPHTRTTTPSEQLPSLLIAAASDQTQYTPGLSWRSMLAQSQQPWRRLQLMPLLAVRAFDSH